MPDVKKKPNIAVLVLVLLLIVAAAMLYWSLFLKTALSGIGEVRKANAELEQDIAALREKLSQKSEIEKNWQDISGREVYLLSRIPQTLDLPQVLGTLERLVLSSELSLESLNAGEIQDEEEYRFIPVSLRMSGGEAQLLWMLEQLEKFTHMTLTERTTIEVEGDPSRLSVDFKLILAPKG